VALDTLRILKAIDDHPDVFRDTRFAVQQAVGKLNETLRKLVGDEIKACDSIPALKRIKVTLGPDSFSNLLAGMNDTAVKKIVSKFDPHHPNQKMASDSWRREHLMSLLEGSTLPAEKPVKPPRERKARSPKKPSAPKRSKVKRERKAASFLENLSAGLTWDPAKK